MKQLLAASVLALSVLAGTQQTASAWCHSKFSIGLNWECTAGNNNLFWGAWRNGATPDPYGGGFGGGYGPGPGGPGPYDHGAPGTPFPYFGNAAPSSGAPSLPAQQQNVPAPNPTQFANYNLQNNYYPASYSYPGSYYPMSYAYPGNGYYGYNYYGE
jgi:hypothetical protein